MTNLIIVSFIIFIVAVSMTMVGKGGGNFYVVVLVIAGIPMHEAATTSQFILFSASVAAMMIFQKNGAVSWKLAIFIGTFTALSALGGGYFSHLFSGFSLKLIFAFLLMISGTVMLIPLSEARVITKKRNSRIMNIRSGGEIYGVDIWVVLPVTILTGFGSGMVGVAGGSFLVPLMVLACRVPMHMAVGTSSILVASTALMGFTGHALQGDFNALWAVPLACITIIGGIAGGNISLKTEPKHLKQLFAYTNYLAAFLMIINAIYTK